MSNVKKNTHAKVFIGTIECGEADFDFCKKAIASQSGVSFDHFIVSNLPEKEAHERLYQRWNDEKKNYDLFLKIDADTVLSSNDVVSTYVSMFENNASLTGIQAFLYDYFTDSYIFGLGCVKNTVTIATKVDPLYCDRVDTNHQIVLRGNQLPKVLNPAGYHCFHASEAQALHYGLHRGKKRHDDTMVKVLSAWKNNDNDRKRGMALIGFFLASTFGSNVVNFNYADEAFRKLYDTSITQYEKLLQFMLADVYKHDKQGV